MAKKKTLNGNHATIDDKSKKPGGDYRTNAAVMPGKMDGKSAVLNDEMAQAAREFVNENQK